MSVLEWLQFIADILLFIGDVLGLTVSVIAAIFDFIISFFVFVVSAFNAMNGLEHLLAFSAFGLTMLALYVVKAIFGR